MTFTLTALRVGAGIVVWALHFATVYGFTALACARDAAQYVPWIVGVTTLGAAVLALVVILIGWRERERFESWLSATIGGFALTAILFGSVPILLLTPCA